MFFLRSISLRRLVWLGFTLAVLPLVMAIVSVVFAVEELAALSQQTVYQVAQQTQNSRMLLERLTELERKGRQFVVLREVQALAAYEESRQDFLKILASLSKLPTPEYLFELLRILRREEAGVYQWINQLPLESEVKSTPGNSAKAGGHVRQISLMLEQDNLRAADSFQNLNGKAVEISHGYSEYVDQVAQDLDIRSREIQRRLLLQSSLLLPIAVGLISFFVYLIIRPIKRMDQAIRSLGGGNFSRPIKIIGPKDLEYLGERLEWLRTRLNTLEEAKQLFMRNVSHEIKTPLATIHEGTGLLADEVVGELNPEQREIAQIIVSNTQKLETMIAELINYSQVNALKREKEFELFDMRELIKAQLENYQLQFRAKSLLVKESLSEVKLYGSAEQLRTIVDNLLSNAVKYSPVGGEIRIFLTQSSDYMILEIEDEGPGIDPDERAEVFEPFYQGRAGREAGIKGTGFGLAIVSECVASHRGKIEIFNSDDPHTGAKIKIQIPLQFDN